MAKELNIELTVDNHEEIKNATDQAVRAALEAVGQQAQNYATLLCPVDTGLLRNSITYAVSGSGAKIDSYKSNATHADTKATQKSKTANKPVSKVKSGSYSGTIGSNDETAVYIGSNVEYAPYVEYGTSHSAAQPFLKPAAEDHTEEYKSIFTENIESALN